MKQNADKPLVVGLTGQTGAGKTTVSEAFRKNGYAVINADLVAREVTANPHIVARLGELFGQDVVAPDATLDRKALAAKVFSDPDELLKLNTILYPIITRKIRERIDELAAQGKKRVLLDAPTLFESGANRLCDKTVAVLADEGLRRERIMARDRLTEEEASRRISAQPKDSFYKARASFLLRNDGTPEQLAAAAQPVIDRLERRAGSSARSMLVLTAAFLGCVLFIWGAFLGIFRLQYPRRYAETVSSAAAETGVAPSLLYAVMKEGSGFDPDYAEDGRTGVFPLTEEQLAALPEETDPAALSDPETSIRCGAAYLAQLSEEFADDRAVLAAWYAGEEQAREWLADSEWSADGQTLTGVPDEGAREFITDAEGARLLYQKLYKLD